MNIRLQIYYTYLFIHNCKYQIYTHIKEIGYSIYQPGMTLRRAMKEKSTTRTPPFFSKKQFISSPVAENRVNEEIGQEKSQIGRAHV